MNNNENKKLPYMSYLFKALSMIIVLISVTFSWFVFTKETTIDGSITGQATDAISVSISDESQNSWNNKLQITTESGLVPTTEFSGNGEKFYIPIVEKNAKYYAVFEEIYTITFIDEKGTELEVQKVALNKSPEKPADPTKDQDAQNTYTFAGWKSSIDEKVYKDSFPPVTSNVTYTAQFTATARQYTVTWVVEGQKNVVETYNADDIPTYKHGTPTKQDVYNTYKEVVQRLDSEMYVREAAS